MSTYKTAATLTLILTVSAAIPPAPAAEPTAEGSAVGMTAEELDRHIREFLLENPEVVIEAIQTYQARQRAAQAEQAKAAVAARSEELLRDPGAPVGGNPEGDVTVVEFFDYNCPYCKVAAPLLAEAESGDPDLRIVYKELPVLGPVSAFAARAALAAREQGQYEAFHRALMGAPGRLTEDKVMKIAQSVGLDTERLEADMEDPELQAILDRNLGLARAIGVTGTPGFVVGENVQQGVPSDLQTLQQWVDDAREAAASP